MFQSRVKLVPGYGVYLSKMQLDEVEGESNNSPTRLTYKKLNISFFPTCTIGTLKCIWHKKECCFTEGHSPCLYP